MEIELLLLGLLRQHEMYGYQINDLIESHLSYGVNLTKPTAYRILHHLAEKGLIRFHDEQVGKRPTRRIYSISGKGEARFQELLRVSLGHYEPIDTINTVSMAFINELPLDEVLPLLEERRKSVEMLIAQIRSDENLNGDFQYTINHHLLHLETDLEWLSGLINHMKSSEVATSVSG